MEDDVQTTFADVKKNPYSVWQRHEPRNRAFLAVADELVRQMQARVEGGIALNFFYFQSSDFQCDIFT